GTAVRESIEIIRAAGAELAAVALALDRQERGQGERSAVQEVEAEYGVPCVSIVTLADLIEALSKPSAGRTRISAEQLTSLEAYRDHYSVR
ncbi:MAG: orotate phosphoribosyltransferase, partial [Steroidobacteraceae bacterium]